LTVPPLPESEPTVDLRAAGIGLGRGEGERAGTGLGEAAGATDGAGKAGVCRLIHGQVAIAEGDRAAATG